MSREKKQSFMGGVTVMAISTVFVKICGALYKIPLNNILGDESKPPAKEWSDPWL